MSFQMAKIRQNANTLACIYKFGSVTLHQYKEEKEEHSFLLKLIYLCGIASDRCKMHNTREWAIGPGCPAGAIGPWVIMSDTGRDGLIAGHVPLGKKMYVW